MYASDFASILTLQRRYREDKRVNSIAIDVIVDGVSTSIPSEAIQPGDIVYVKNGAMIPADLVLLSSSHPEGIAYVNTANLDGYISMDVCVWLLMTAVKRI